MRGHPGSWREFAAVAAGFGLLTAVLTYPLSFNLASLARIDSADGQFSIWNVAWVAHALLTSPRHVFDANIFYPHTGTLAYSEANLAAGVLATPVYWATRNPYAAHNFVVLLSFALSAIASYYLLRYLVGDRRAAIVGAIAFAFTPHLFSHLSHIQLLMTAGIPLALLAFHRLADRPSPRRGIALGLAMAAEAYACAYYSIFVMLMVGLLTLLTAVVRPLWRDYRYWLGIAVAGGVAIVAVLPLFLEYVSLQRETGFERTLAEAAHYSADWRAYFASPAYLHIWLLRAIGHWKEVLFPGFVALIVAMVGAKTGWSSGRGTRERELTILYGAIALLALWASFGPAAGLYSALYSVVPGFTFLRAPSRFGLLVALSLSVIGSIGVAKRLVTAPRPKVLFAVLLGLIIAESVETVSFSPVPGPSPAYDVLASAPRGPVLELPVYSNRFAFMRARYMLASTAHWQPLINAYSDYIPPDFVAAEGQLGHFPSHESFATLKEMGGRYAVFHLNQYRGAQRTELANRIEQFKPYLRQLYEDEGTWVYEIVQYPSELADGPLPPRDHDVVH
jgi:hypothetical protein